MCNRVWLLVLLLLCFCHCASVAAITDAKLLPDNSSLVVQSVVVTYISTDFFYVEDGFRINGIRVDKAAHGLSPGNRVDVSGVIKTNTDKERYIAASSVNVVGSGSVKPYAMNNAAIGGGDYFYNLSNGSGQRGVTAASGLNNVGLLVKTWGKVQQIDSSTFSIDDGFGLEIRCIAPTGLTVDPLWRYGVVEGVVSLSRITSYLYLPILRVTRYYDQITEEVVTVPNAPTGQASPVVGTTYTYSVSGASSNLGHTLEYKFNWGDGTSSEWSTSNSASHKWMSMGPKSITVDVRCKAHPTVSAVSPAYTVNVVEISVTWQRSNGPNSSPASSTYVTPSGVMYAYLWCDTNTTLVGWKWFRSNDGGQSWTKLATSGGMGILTSDNTGKLFGFHISTNKAYYWSEPQQDWVTLGSLGGKPRAAVVNASNELIVGVEGKGVVQSTDSGLTWLAYGTGLETKTIFSVAINSSGHVFAVARDGIYSGPFRIYRNTTGGAWEEIGSGIISAGYNTKVFVDRDGKVFAATDTGQIFRSVDNGNTWVQISTVSGSYIRSIAETSGGVLLCCSDNKLFRSYDHGVTWTEKSFTVPYSSVSSVAVGPNDVVIAGTADGVYRSTDIGNTWTNVNSYFADDYVHSMADGGDGYFYVKTRESGLFRTSDHGQTWTKIMGHIGYSHIYTNPQGHIFVGGVSCLYRSTDHGASWTVLQSGLPQNHSITVVAASNQVLIAATGYSFNNVLFTYCCRSLDNGNSWTPCNMSSSNFMTATILPLGRILAATEYEVYRSDDNGSTWILSTTGVSTNAKIDMMVRNPNGVIFARASNQTGIMYKSTNDGLTWSQVSTTKFPRIFNANGHAFACDGYSAYRSYDDGMTWAMLGFSAAEYKNWEHLGMDSFGYLYLAAGYSTYSSPQTYLFRTNVPVSY